MVKEAIGYFIVAMRMAELSSEQIREICEAIPNIKSTTSPEVALQIYESTLEKVERGILKWGNE